MSESVCGNYAINIYYWRNVLKMQVTLETSIITAWTTRIPSPLSLHLKDFCREFISIMPHCFQIILIILLSLSNPIHIKFYRLKFCFHIWRDAAIDHSCFERNIKNTRHSSSCTFSLILSLPLASLNLKLIPQLSIFL